MEAVNEILKAPMGRNFGDTIKGALYAILSVICLSVKLFWLISKHAFKALSVILGFGARGAAWMASKL